jgi:hypothetical protein
MMDANGIEQLCLALRKRGFDEAKAEQYCVLIGDTPEVDTNGKWVIRDDDGQVLDRIDAVSEQ